MKLPLEKYHQWRTDTSLVQQFQSIWVIYEDLCIFVKGRFVCEPWDQLQVLAMNSSDISASQDKACRGSKSWMGDREERISDIDYSFGIASSTATISWMRSSSRYEGKQTERFSLPNIFIWRYLLCFLFCIYKYPFALFSFKFQSMRSNV